MQNVAYIGSTEDIIECMFGPFQHDAHVLTRHRHFRLQERKAASARACEAVRALVLEMNADCRAKRAAHFAELALLHNPPIGS